MKATAWSTPSCGTIMYYRVHGGSNFWVCGWNPKVRPFIPNESYWVVLSCGAVYHVVQGGSNFWVDVSICGLNSKVWPFKRKPTGQYDFPVVLFLCTVVRTFASVEGTPKSKHTVCCDVQSLINYNFANFNLEPLSRGQHLQLCFSWASLETFLYFRSMTLPGWRWNGSWTHCSICLWYQRIEKRI